MTSDSRFTIWNKKYLQFEYMGLTLKDGSKPNTDPQKSVSYNIPKVSGIKKPGTGIFNFSRHWLWRRQGQIWSNKTFDMVRYAMTYMCTTSSCDGLPQTSLISYFRQICVFQIVNHSETK